MVIQITQCNFAQPLVQPLHLPSPNCFTAFPYSLPLPSPTTLSFSVTLILAHVIFHSPLWSKPRLNMDLIWRFLPHRLCFLCSFPHWASPLPSEFVNAEGQGSPLFHAEQNPGTRQALRWLIQSTPQGLWLTVPGYHSWYIPGYSMANGKCIKWRAVYPRDLLENGLVVGVHNPDPHQQYVKVTSYFRTESEEQQLNFLTVLLNAEKVPKRNFILIIN